MGHYTVLKDNAEAALGLALEIKQALEVRQSPREREMEEQGSE